MRQTSFWGKRRSTSWPMTKVTSFRLIKDDPLSVGFYDGRHKGGALPKYHEVFQAIADAADVFELLKRIQKDAI